MGHVFAVNWLVSTQLSLAGFQQQQTLSRVSLLSPLLSPSTPLSRLCSERSAAASPRPIMNKRSIIKTRSVFHKHRTRLTIESRVSNCCRHMWHAIQALESARKRSVQKDNSRASKIYFYLLALSATCPLNCHRPFCNLTHSTS